MDAILESFSRCMAFENGMDIETARGMTKWLENEGALDYDTLRETYVEPATPSDIVPTLHLVSNDA